LENLASPGTPWNPRPGNPGRNLGKSRNPGSTPRLGSPGKNLGKKRGKSRNPGSTPGPGNPGKTPGTLGASLGLENLESPGIFGKQP